MTVYTLSRELCCKENLEKTKRRTLLFLETEIKENFSTILLFTSLKTQRCSRRLPALIGLKLRFRISKPSLEHSRGFPDFPSQIWGKSFQGFMIYDRTVKQTNRDYYFILFTTVYRGHAPSYVLLSQVHIDPDCYEKLHLFSSLDPL